MPKLDDVMKNKLLRKHFYAYSQKNHILMTKLDVNRIFLILIPRFQNEVQDN